MALEGFSSIGSWCYSSEWVWNSRTKLCYIALGECNASKVSLQEFDIGVYFRLIMMNVFQWSNC